ncbi:MAG: DUF2318 domain-containing protein [Candidatus Altiarchaeota archaeon]
MAKKNAKNQVTVRQNHILLAVALVGIALAYLATSSPAGDAGGYTTQTTVRQPANAGENLDDSVVRIPLSEVSTQVRKYTYSLGPTTIRYIVVEGSDGKPRVAFDACEVCGGSLGYRQEGTDVACIKCGRRFRIDDLGEKNMGGGCWPAHLPHYMEDGNIVIRKSDIEFGGRFF